MSSDNVVSKLEALKTDPNNMLNRVTLKTVFKPFENKFLDKIYILNLLKNRNYSSRLHYVI